MYKVQKDLVPEETIELFEPFRFTNTYNTRSSDSEDFQLYKASSCNDPLHMQALKPGMNYPGT